MKLQRSDIKIRQYFRILSIAALISGAAILFFGCENNIEQIKPFFENENLPVLEATNFESLFTDSGQVIYSLKAPKLYQFEDEGRNYVEFPEGMEMIKYDDKNHIISSITADYAKQFVSEDKWEAKNNIVATNAQGDTLKTDHLFWEEKKDLIYTEDAVTIIGEDKYLTGFGLISDQKFQNWKIKHPTGNFFVTVNNNSESTSKQDTLPPIENQSDVKPEKGKLQFNK